MTHFKDEVLLSLSVKSNVAQFVSFSPQGRIRHSALRGLGMDGRIGSLPEAVDALLQRSRQREVRVRSFLPEEGQDKPFTAKALGKVDEIVALVRRLCADGLFVIVNESLSVDDGGVSGVLHGTLMEFSPRAVPRCVESEGVVSVDHTFGRRLLSTIYGFSPDLDFSALERVEFSVHPTACGYQNRHTVIWEVQSLPAPTEAHHRPRWPNNMSRMIGDKAFGLLVAYLSGLPVPRSLVIPRFLPAFSFGIATGTNNVWLRTCPAEPRPGEFKTVRGWTDPFKIMQEEDPTGQEITSILQQEEVSPTFSGALRPEANGALIEGVAGAGDDFMMSRQGRQKLPEKVIEAVRSLYADVEERLGPVRMEWVYDGERPWVVQMHAASGPASPNGWIFPGEPASFLTFRTANGLAALRSLVRRVKDNDQGIVLVGDIGLTSHMCDLLRQQRIPSRLEPATNRGRPVEGVSSRVDDQP